MRVDIGSRKDRREFVAVPLTPNAQQAHPEGVRRVYTTPANMIRFGLRGAYPGQYSITDAESGKEITTAYVRVSIPAWIEYARKRGVERMGEPLELAPENFRRIDGGLTIDGMDPGEWIDAMLME